MKTSDFMDVAEREILNNFSSQKQSEPSTSEPSTKIEESQDTGQRELNDAEFEEELGLVKMNWKISDGSTPNPVQSKPTPGKPESEEEEKKEETQKSEYQMRKQ